MDEIYEKLLKTVTNLGSPKVLVVGDFMLDVYIYGDALRISPEAPVPVLKVTGKPEYSCGGAGSVAANLAALGAVPYCLGVIGKDSNGKILKEMLTETGAETAGLFTVANRPTTAKQRLIGLAQHRHRQQLIRIDEESIEPLSDELNEAILQVYKDNLEQTDIVCLQDYNKGLLSSSVCKQMIQLATQANKKVLIDPSFISDYSKYTGATVITPNRQETSKVIAFEIKSNKDAARAAEVSKLLQSFAKTIKELSPDYTVARIGGDEFAILVENSNEEELEKIEFRIKETIKELGLFGIDFEVSVGYGVLDEERSDYTKVYNNQ